jgi:hypothetical protein
MLFYATPFAICFLGWLIFEIFFGWLKRRFQLLPFSVRFVILLHICYLAVGLGIIALSLYGSPANEPLFFSALVVEGFGLYLMIDKEFLLS